jgi:hypothetical protein
MATDCQQFLFAPLAPIAQIPAKLDTQTWAALIVAVLATIYLVLRSKAKSRKDPLSRQPAGPSLAQQRAVERQMSNLLVELSEMARAVSAGLDTRAAKLQVLIDEADQRIAELKALSGHVSPQLSKPQPSITPTTTMRLVSDTTPESAVQDEPGSSDPRHQQVYELAALGKSAHEIAVMLGQPRGEIELILALHPRRAAEGG